MIEAKFPGCVSFLPVLVFTIYLMRYLFIGHSSGFIETILSWTEMVYGKVSTKTVGSPFIYATRLSQFFCLILISSETREAPPLAVPFILMEFIDMRVRKLGIFRLMLSSPTFDTSRGDWLVKISSSCSIT